MVLPPTLSANSAEAGGKLHAFSFPSVLQQCKPMGKSLLQTRDEWIFCLSSLSFRDCGQVEAQQFSGWSDSNTREMACGRKMGSSFFSAPFTGGLQG